MSTDQEISRRARGKATSHTAATVQKAYCAENEDERKGQHISYRGYTAQACFCTWGNLSHAHDIKEAIVIGPQRVTGSSTHAALGTSRLGQNTSRVQLKDGRVYTL